MKLYRIKILLVVAMTTYVMDSVKMLTTLSTIKWGYVKNPVTYAMQ